MASPPPSELRKECSNPSPSFAAEERAGWLSGIVASAGRLVAAVLGPTPSVTEEDPLLEEEGDDSENYVGAESIVRNGVLELGRFEGPLAIVPKVDQKNVIVQLLMQETFSRDECNDIIEIIQSRVVEPNEVEIDPRRSQKFPPSISRSDALPITWNVREPAGNAFNPLFSPGAPLASFMGTNIPEAKNWLEESNRNLHLTPSSCQASMLNAKKTVEEKYLRTPAGRSFDETQRGHTKLSVKWPDVMCVGENDIAAGSGCLHENSRKVTPLFEHCGPIIEKSDNYPLNDDANSVSKQMVKKEPDAAPKRKQRAPRSRAEQIASTTTTTGRRRRAVARKIKPENTAVPSSGPASPTFQCSSDRASTMQPQRRRRRADSDSDFAMESSKRGRIPAKRRARRGKKAATGETTSPANPRSSAKRAAGRPRKAVGPV